MMLKICNAFRNAMKFFFLLFLASLFSGCGSTNDFKKSPCACNFERVNDVKA